MSEDLRLLGLNTRTASDGEVNLDGSLTQHCLEKQALKVDDETCLCVKFDIIVFKAEVSNKM